MIRNKSICFVCWWSIHPKKKKRRKLCIMCFMQWCSFLSFFSLMDTSKKQTKKNFIPLLIHPVHLRFTLLYGSLKLSPVETYTSESGGISYASNTSFPLSRNTLLAANPRPKRSVHISRNWKKKSQINKIILKIWQLWLHISLHELLRGSVVSDRQLIREKKFVNLKVF
jgi:hypothetical protein